MLLSCIFGALNFLAAGGKHMQGSVVLLLVVVVVATRRAKVKLKLKLKLKHEPHSTRNKLQLVQVAK